MQAKTLDYIGRRTYPANLSAHIAFRAIMATIQSTGLPKAYLSDVAIDADHLYRNSPKRFVYVLRDSGTHIWSQPDPTLSLSGILSCVGKDAKFYTYDEDRVEAHREMPELQEVTAEEMYAFLRQIGAEKSEKRYLTPSECDVISNILRAEQGFDSDLWAYVTNMENHTPANGQCYEVCLTKQEAREVDAVCEQLGISTG